MKAKFTSSCVSCGDEIKRGKEITKDTSGKWVHKHCASETFDLSEVMRGQTAGKAMWNTHFKEWSPVPSSLQSQLMADIRKRKGLSPEPPSADEFIDKE